MNATLEPDPVLFEGGPFPHFQRSLSLFKPVGLRTTPRAALVVIIGWVPLIVLVIAQGVLVHRSLWGSFLYDVGVHVRSLIAAPLFIVAESITLPRLGRVAYHFLNAGLVIDDDLPRFNAAVASTRRLLNSTVAEVLAVVLAYIVAIAMIRYVPSSILATWYIDGSSRLSWAGWWYGLVSLPLLLILIFSWIWRVALWGRFLIIMSRLKLRLIAAHPDRAAGLKFLDNSLFAFMPVSFTIGVIVAGAVANRVLNQQATPIRVEQTMLVLTALVLVLFVGPLLIFISNLFIEKRFGVLKYGSLAQRVGLEFERKWVDHSEEVDQTALEQPDFSATTDLYQIVSNVHEISGLPFDVKSLIGLILVTLLPFIPVALLAIPLVVLLEEAAKLLL